MTPFQLGDYRCLKVIRGLVQASIGPETSSDELDCLNRLIEGRPGVDPSIQMPHGKTKLTEAELTTIRKWVDQGAKNN